MAKLDPVVKTETIHVAIWVLAVGALTQAVCLICGWWDWPVLLGSLLGAVTAVGNFLLLCRMVQKAVGQEKKQAANTIKLSQSLRLIMQGLMLVLTAVLPTVFNIWAAAILLLIPTIVIRVRELRRAKANPSPNRPAIGWEDEDEED